MSHKYVVISHKLYKNRDKVTIELVIGTLSALLIGTIFNDLERSLILISRTLQFSHDIEHRMTYLQQLSF